MTLGRKIFLIYIILFAIATGLAVHYYTPATTIVKITGTEIKLSDKDGRISKANPVDGAAYDIYYISTQNEKGKIMMYRNEDTGWGPPWYFKFNSADLQARALSISQSGKHAILVSYGWRFNIPSMFKNVLSLKAIEDPNVSTFSVYTLITIGSWLAWLALIVAQTVGYVKFSRWREEREFKGPY